MAVEALLSRLCVACLRHSLSHTPIRLPLRFNPCSDTESVPAQDPCLVTHLGVSLSQSVAVASDWMK